MFGGTYLETTNDEGSRTEAVKFGVLKEEEIDWVEAAEVWNRFQAQLRVAVAAKVGEWNHC